MRLFLFSKEPDMSDTKNSTMQDEAARNKAEAEAAASRVRGNDAGDVVDTTQGGTTQGRFRKQITVEKIIGKVLQDWIPEKGQEPKWLVSIMGQVEAFETGQTQFGPFMRLGGEFISTNLLTGEETDGPVCILPGMGEMVVRNQLRAVGFGSGKPDAPKAVVFGMDIGIEWNKPDEFEINGEKVIVKKYTWAIRPRGAKAKTSLRMIKEQMDADQKLLAAAPPAAITDAPEPETIAGIGEKNKAKASK
jgi:hypothetical protein